MLARCAHRAAAARGAAMIPSSSTPSSLARVGSAITGGGDARRFMAYDSAPPVPHGYPFRVVVTEFVLKVTKNFFSFFGVPLGAFGALRALHRASGRR